MVKLYKSPWHVPPMSAQKLADACVKLGDKVNELQAENDELRARVGELEALLKRYNGLINDEEIDLKGTYLHLNTGDTLTKSPTQSLNDLKSDAVKEAVEFFEPALDIDSEALISYANQLRNQTAQATATGPAGADRGRIENEI